MTNRSRFMAVTGVLALVVIVALIAYEAGRSSGAKKAETTSASEPPSEVTAAVQTVLAREATLKRTITAYGTIVPAPGGIHNLSVPFECQIERVAASEGQAVSKAEVLLVVTGSPDAKLALAQARADARAAGEAAKQMRERHRLKLADDAALAQAEAAADAAGSRLKSMEARHLEEHHEVRVPEGGIATKLSFAVGAVVPAGVTMAEVAQSGDAEVRLGVEPSEAPNLASGSTASIQVVDADAPPIEGRVRAVSPAINPGTRLADVFVTLPPGSHPSLGRYVRGSLTTTTSNGLVVPYAAVLPSGEGSVLFTVRDGHAVRHEVHVVLESGDEVLISAPGVTAGDAVVISGNYEIEDGMALKVAPHS